MEQQLHRRLPVPELAAAAGVSTAQLTRLFRDATGVTPAAFLRTLRMTRARLLLERTSLSVTEVMAQVGIADRSHFVRDFQRAHGVAPREVRELLKATSP
jgi:transcriptional regulator GlxA family with amidase domain